MNRKCSKLDRAGNSWLEITATVVTVVDQIYSCLKVLHLEYSHLEIIIKLWIHFRGFALIFFPLFAISMLKQFLFQFFLFTSYLCY